MFNNNGMNNNGLGNRNIAGIRNTPSNIGGINKTPTNISGINKMPTANNPFSNVKIDRQRSTQIMNSSGENVIRNNNMNNGGGFNGN